MSLLKRYANIKNQELEKIYFNDFDGDLLEFFNYILNNKYTIEDFFNFYKYEGFNLNINSNSIDMIFEIKRKSGLSYQKIFNNLNAYYNLSYLNQLLNTFGVDELLDVHISNGNVYNLYEIYKKNPNNLLKEFIIKKANKNVDLIIASLNSGIDFFIDDVLEILIKSINIHAMLKEVRLDESLYKIFKDKILSNQRFIEKAKNNLNDLLFIFKTYYMHDIILNDLKLYDIYSYYLMTKLLKLINIADPLNFDDQKKKNYLSNILEYFNKIPSYNGLKQAIIESNTIIPLDIILLLRIPISEFNNIFNQVNKKIKLPYDKNEVVSKIEDIASKETEGAEFFTYLLKLHKLNNKLLNIILENLFSKEQKTISDILYIFNDYINATNKPIESIYHDYLKQNPFNIYKIKDYIEKLSNYAIENNNLNSIINFPRVQNFGQYFNLKLRQLDLAKELHNDTDIEKYCDKLFNNTKLDLEEDYVDNFIEIYEFKQNEQENINKLSTIINKFKEKGFDIDIAEITNLLKEYSKYIDEFNNNTLSPSADLISKSKYLQTYVSYVEMFDNVNNYINQAKPKNKELFKLNLSFDDFEFKVLDDLDPLHFKIGIDTDCCQRIGGAGEEAAVDSFINPLAGVLVLYKNYKLLSQSYFHYVPQHNGYILDNIEFNENEVKKYDKNIKNEQSSWLADVYKEYGKLIQQKHPDINYIKIGKEYSKITLNDFQEDRLNNDPRTFDVDDSYTDFDNDDHVNLFKNNNFYEETEQLEEEYY